MKKKMALLLCLALIFTMIPTTALADEQTEQTKTLYWCVNLPSVVALEQVGTSDEYKLVSSDETKAQLTESDLSAWNNGQIDKTVGDADMNIYIAYVKEDGFAYTSSDIISQNTDAVTVKWNEDGYYTVEFVGLGGPEIIVDNHRDYGILKIDVQEGNQGGNGGAQGSSNIRLLSGTYDRITSVFLYDELGDTHKFYIVVDAGKPDLTLNVKITDHYRTSHNAWVNGTREDVTVTSDAVEINPISDRTANEFTKAANAAGFDEKNTGIYVFEATVNNENLKTFSYRKGGIVRGKLCVYQEGKSEEDGYGYDITICSSGFASEDTVINGNSQGTLSFVDKQGESISEKKIELFKALNSDDNKLYLKVEKGTEPTIYAYSKYSATDGYVYESLSDMVEINKDETYNSDVMDLYTITLKKSYGHNDLILVARTETDGPQAVLTVKKSIAYKFDEKAFAAADDINDYMNNISASAIGTTKQKSRLESQAAEDGKILKVDNNVGGKRSANMPYNGGYYGTVIKLADDYKLKGIKTTGYDKDGKLTESHLDYLINQNIYYKVTNTGDSIDEDIFENDYEAFQISARNGEEYMVEVDIGLAEFNYDENDKRYYMNPYDALENAVIGYSNFAQWLNETFGSGNYKVEFIDTCMYYDISCAFIEDNDILRKDAETEGYTIETLQDMYDKFDLVGTIEFETETDGVNKFDGNSNNVGVNATGDVSADCWSENAFDEFGSTVGDSNDIEKHEDVIENFNGNDDETVVSAYGFEMGENDFEGMLDVYMPIPESVEENPEDCKVYWMASNGENDPYPIPMPARYVKNENGDGYMVFTTSHFSDYVLVADTDNVKDNSGDTSKPSGSTGGGGTAVTPDVTTDTSVSTTTSKTDVKVSESTNADGTTSNAATVSVSAANQKEILKQAAAKKSENIVLNVSAADTKNADTVEVTLDKSFIESIVNDTNATLTIKTPLGDKTYTQEELKSLATSADGKTVTITIAKSGEKTDEEMQQQAQQGAEKAIMKARSSKTAKGNIKVVFRPDEETENFIKEMKALGYTVKYRFYRSTKKSSGYKAMLTKSGRTYINTSGKSGTRYYYKVQALIYDANGKLVAKTALKQCKYACRQWTK